jgi:transcriptional regulator with XRE-family HTH domain
MDPSFGARLRQQREQQQIALTAIAEQTKIKLSLLEALERDDVSHWPSGIFGRSYVRTYARAIGLDADTTVREFLMLHPDRVEQAPPDLVGASGDGAESTSRRPPMRLRFLLGSAINALPALHGQAGYKLGLGLDKGPVVDAHRTTVASRPIPVQPEVTVTTPDVEPAPAIEPLPAASDVALAGHRDRGVDFSVLADLCTRLGRALEVDEVAAALQDAVGALDAVGLILWMHDPLGGALTPSLAHGYSDEVLAHLPRVPIHTDNAIAAAFRSFETRVVDGSRVATGALVVPLSTPTGCAGVLALEFRDGAEQDASVRSFAIILAAQLSTLFECPALAQAVNA